MKKYKLYNCQKILKRDHISVFQSHLFKINISENNQSSVMTMNCPQCGTLMIWLNGSIMHEQQINYYECRNCKIKLNTLSDGTYEITQEENEQRLE